MTGRQKLFSKTSRLYRVATWLHLWLGLLSALILALVCFTGALVVYADEIIEYRARDLLHVNAPTEATMDFDRSVQAVRDANPKQRIFYAAAHKSKHRALRVLVGTKEEGLTNYYVDPYRFNILGKDRSIQFFFIVAHLHSELLSGEVGAWIVLGSTLICLFELATGLWMWWPKTRRALGRAFTLRQSSGTYRFNWDLHTVVGFYALAPLFVLSTSGLILAWPGATEWTIEQFGGSETKKWEAELPEIPRRPEHTGVQVALARELARSDIEEVLVPLFPYRESSRQALLTAARLHLKSRDGGRYLLVDKGSGSATPVPEKVARGETVRNWIWRLHMGTWAGQLGKLVSVSASLVGASLPITGFLIWYWRRAKQKRPRLRSPRRAIEIEREAA